MTSLFKWLRGSALVIGVIGGAVLGGFLAQRFGTSAGEEIASSDASPLLAGFLKARSVQATASQGQEALVMATGEVDSGIEAVYVLDSLTGELNGGVINNNTRKFTIHYSYKNIVQDLGAGTVKNPKFVMVTGELPITQGRGQRMGRSALYIAEMNSGFVVAYGVPWSSTQYAGGQSADVPLVPLDRFKFRQAILRPQ